MAGLDRLDAFMRLTVLQFITLTVPAIAHVTEIRNWLVLHVAASPSKMPPPSSSRSRQYCAADDAGPGHASHLSRPSSQPNGTF